MSERWNFEDTGLNSGVFNMQYDEQLAREVASGNRLPTVRVYGWRPAAISFGWNQQLDEIDVETANRSGIDVVRRPTGGRAILHSDELTYSVVKVVEHESISAVYQAISLALVRGLKELGIEAALEKVQPDFSSLYHTRSGAVCFSSSARNEIKVAGRKLVGSAQRRFYYSGKEVVLQHGSILLGPDHLRIVDFFKLDGPIERKVLRQELSDKTTTISSIVGSSLSFTDVVQAVRHGFESEWGIVFTSHLLQETVTA